MKITRESLCELIVRDFAVKYLHLQPPFHLYHVIAATKNTFNYKIKDEEFYTLADVRYCMRVLKLNNNFSRIRKCEYEEIDTKEVFQYYQSKDNILSLYLYDIINSLPTTGGNIIECRKCGNLFIPDHGNRKICFSCSNEK